MTFYEAALRVLEREGRPLTYLEITERSVAEDLLSHVGKTPEQTMLSRLSAMARRARDRRVAVTGPQTFALVDWNLPEDPESLAQMGQPEAHPEEGLPALRPPERHPEPRTDNVRAAGRQERKRRRDEDDDRSRRRRYPPMAEVAFELLSEAPDALEVAEFLERARGRDLLSEETRPEQLLAALSEDNQRRIDAGRRPQFQLVEGRLSLETSDGPAREIQAAFAAALAGGPAAPVEAPSEPPSGTAFSSLRAAVREARRGMERTLRDHLAGLEPLTFEKACVRLLQAEGFRELKVAKRFRDGPLFTARRREGSVELRWAVRILRASAAIDRQAVQECKRDLGHHSAQAGLVLGTGEVRGEARREAQSHGPLVSIWGGEALAEKFLEARVGVRVVTLELEELDLGFFEEAGRDAAESARRREERHRERTEERRREGPDVRGDAVPAERTASTADGADESDAVPAEAEQDGAEEGEDGPVSSADVAAGPEGERKRRRRRRRGRRGRGSAPGETTPALTEPRAAGEAPVAAADAVAESAPAAESRRGEEGESVEDR